MPKTVTSAPVFVCDVSTAKFSKVCFKHKNEKKLNNLIPFIKNLSKINATYIVILNINNSFRSKDVLEYLV